jgi:regulator of sirC expression with transglutaminase-like and TPR domain
MRSRVAGVLLALSLGTSIAAAAKPKKPAPPSDEAPEIAGATKIMEQVKPSLAKITQMGREGVEGLGSGFVISKDGLIATNMHVVGQGRRLQVEMPDGRSFEVKAVHASDYHLDLAILRVEADDLKPLKLGDSDTVKQGQPIVGLGNPAGLDFSVVQGVVSAIRDVEKQPMIQIAMPIERGNSGGPLIDRKGNVLGILTLKSLRTENLGFATPVNTLKKLMEKPNTVPMERWLTLGVLDTRLWKTLMGAKWTQRAGVIKGELPGEGFGGRTLCISQLEEPKVPFEVVVDVRLNDEAGAAGLIFCSDGENRHYGFYPTDGKIRMTRFEGPDVFSWTPFQTVDCEAYRPGEWNRLRVRVEEDRIIGYVNGVKAIEQQDDAFRDGKVGLCKFRNTQAEYKGFRVGSDLRDKPVDEDVAERVGKTLDAFLTKASAKGETLNKLHDEHAAGRRALSDRVKELEARAAGLRQQAASLRKLSTELHQRTVAGDLAALLAKPDDEINLLQAALLIARHDNPEVDVNTYRRLMDRMADELREDAEIKKGGRAAVQRISDYLFRENGYHGSHYDYENNANSYLNEVLDNREGLPISLAVVFLELADRLKVEGVTGISFPSRFMVGWRAKEEDAWQLVDVFDGGKWLTVEEAADAVLGDKSAIDSDGLQAATKQMIVERMVRNLIGFVQGENMMPPPAAMPYLNLLIALDADDTSLRFNRAAARSAEGDNAGAREDIKFILDNPPASMDEEQLRQLHEMYEKLGRHS